MPCWIDAQGAAVVPQPAASLPPGATNTARLASPSIPSQFESVNCGSGASGFLLHADPPSPGVVGAGARVPVASGIGLLDAAQLLRSFDSLTFFFASAQA